jgi:hypothetical protein
VARRSKLQRSGDGVAVVAISERRYFLAIANLYLRTTVVNRLISHKTDRYGGRDIWNWAMVSWPNNEINAGRALARIRIGMCGRAVLLTGRFGLLDRAGDIVSAAAELPNSDGDNAYNDNRE